ncbi:PREDICTED: atherin-like [Nipponia nippon]|uniref:atherin-like n=1 Tax=Nipponia nippon TaxID=128390 RepID=UPI000510A235|nr:PREDICTED: atherin-like [Nipponia nippon]
MPGPELSPPPGAPAPPEAPADGGQRNVPGTGAACRNPAGQRPPSPSPSPSPGDVSASN